MAFTLFVTAARVTSARTCASCRAAAVALLALAGRGSAFPALLAQQCSRAVEVGEPIMAGPAVGETELTFADIVWTREDGTDVACGGAYAPGEVLHVAVDASSGAGARVLLEARGGARFVGGETETFCGGTRAEGPAHGDAALQVVAPGAGAEAI